MTSISRIAQARLIAGRSGSMRPQLHLGRFEAVSEADDPESVADTLGNVAAAFGFPFAQLMVAVPAEKTLPFVLQHQSAKKLEFDRAIIVSTDFSSPYDDVDVDPRVDPVVSQIRKSTLPIIWDEATYIESGLGTVRDWWKERGRHHGVSIRVPALTSPASPPLAVVVSLQRGDPIRQVEMSRVSAHVMLLAAHAAVAAERVLAPRLVSIRESASPLTPTMREYLRWAERGKTALETADIVGRRYSTVNVPLLKSEWVRWRLVEA